LMRLIMRRRSERWEVRRPSAQN